MRKLIGTNLGTYTFNPTSKTITFNNVGSLKLEQITIITNVVDNILIYQFNESTLGGTLLNNVLTLDYNTTTMDANDNLQIWVEIEDVSDLLIGLTYQISLLTDIVKSLANVDGANRQIVSIGSIPTTSVTFPSAQAVTVSSGSINIANTPYIDSQIQGQILSSSQRTNLAFLD